MTLDEWQRNPVIRQMAQEMIDADADISTLTVDDTDLPNLNFTSVTVTEYTSRSGDYTVKSMDFMLACAVLALVRTAQEKACDAGARTTTAH